MPPSVANVPVNQPPYSETEREPQSVAIAYAWRPDVWPFVFLGDTQPYRPFMMPSPFEAVRVDSPPTSSPSASPELNAIQSMWQPDPWTFTFMKGWQPFQPGRMPIHYGYDDPPYAGASLMRSTVAVEFMIAQPDPWTFSFLGRSQPFDARRLPVPISLAPADAPPWTHKNFITEIAGLVDAWQPPPPWAFMGGTQMLAPSLLPPTALNVEVDVPPFSSRRVNFWTISASWEQPPPNPTLAQHSVYPILPLTYSFGIIIV